MSRLRIAAVSLAVLALGWLALSYELLPDLWSRHERDRPTGTVPDALPKVTRDAEDIPGDPLNVSLVGDREDLVLAMQAIDWQPADAVTFDSSVRIAASVAFDRPDPAAPVSPLYLFGRPQDFAFEREIGSSADRRHHVRLWLVESSAAKRLDDSGRPVWIGSASLDIGSGVSHLTGEITHHIGPDLDAERDGLFADLARADQLVSRTQVNGVGATSDGRNAGGDHYFTDGKMDVGVLPER